MKRGKKDGRCDRNGVSDGNWRLRPDDRFASQIYRDSGRPPAASSEVAAPKRRSSLKGLGRSLQFPSSEKNENWGERRELNPQPPDPQSGALTRLSYAHHKGKAEGSKKCSIIGHSPSFFYWHLRKQAYTLGRLSYCKEPLKNNF